MSIEYVPHPYQKEATQFALQNPSAGLLLSVGLGKSVITLTAVDILLSTFEINKPLIIGPKRVVSSVWGNEIKKWSHTSHLKISVIAGTEKQRIKAFNTKADIYAVSIDNICWLILYCSKTIKRWPFDMLIADELSKFKSPSARRFKAVRRILPYVSRFIGLTATPASNNLLDLWAQIYLLDKGVRLGATFGAYKEKYFVLAARNGHVVFNYIPKLGAEEEIYEALKDLCISMKASDYLDLPPRIDLFEEIEMENIEKYNQFKKTEVLMMQDGFELTPVNSAVLYSMLLQYANGAVYRYTADGTRYFEVVDSTKLDVLVDEIDALQGDPVLIFVQFQSDFIRIKERIPYVVKIKTDADIDLWNQGRIPVAMAHGLSIGHGLNLQDGGNHILHFGLGWSLEVYDQSVGRLSRQGNKKSVINKHLICKGTVEEFVLERLQNKSITQEALLLALKKHIS